MPKKEIYVTEDEYSWKLYTSHDLYKIKCVVNKSENQEENMMFVERYFNPYPNIIKVVSMGDDEVVIYEDEIEDKIDEIPMEVEVEDVDGQQ